MNWKKRLCAILMSLAMVLTYMPAFSFAADDAGDAGSDPVSSGSELNEESADKGVQAENSSSADSAQDQGKSQEIAESSSADNSGSDESGKSDSEDEAAAVSDSQSADSGESDQPESAGISSEADDSLASEPEITEGKMEKRKLSFDIGSNDDLLLQYFETEFNGGNSSQQPGMLKARKVPRRNNLSDTAKVIYDEIIPQVKAIAAGERKEPIATYNDDGLGENDDIYEIIYAMVADYPYEFYWFDKTDWLWAGFGTITFPVAEGYRGELLDEEQGIYALDTAKISCAKTAAANARGIVDKYKLNNDFSKLRKYKNEICGLVEYNNEAAYDSSMPYGDPWQMIYVFDGDPSTNVVCEGYSKAFQFLCDNTDFASDEIECFTVTGYMAGGNLIIEDGQEVEYGNHMWNILRMDDGKTYTADITNCDVESVVQANALFLGGAMPYDSYKLIKYSYYGDYADISYAYDAEARQMYSESELSVSTTPYSGVEHEHKPGETIYEVYFEPTCTARGFHDEVVICESCNTEISRVTITDPPLGHTEVVVPGKAATCTESGLSDGKKCSVCDAVIVAQKTIPAKGHTADVIDGYAATCTETGLTDGAFCTVCGETIKEQEVIPALGHDWDNGEVTLAPTPYSDGIRTYSCSRCTETYEETIPAGEYEITEDCIEVEDAVYTGSALKPAVTVMFDGEELVEGEDFEVAYSDNVNAGTGTATVTGTGMYTGKADKSFAIAKRAITPAVTLSTVNYTWNNAVKTPGVTVKDGARILKKGTDYDVTYQAGRKNIGRYTVTVTLKGNYTGKRAVTFNINPKPCTIKTPSKAKGAFTAKWKKMATKMPKAAITGYQVQYSTNKTFKTGAKTVTVKGVKKVSRKISGLKKKTTYYVRVRTYISVGGRYYYSTWSSVKSVKTK